MGRNSDTLAFMSELLNKDLQARSTFQRACFLNYAVYLGYQWSYVDQATGELVFVSGDGAKEEVKFRSNKIKVNVEHAVSKTTHNNPDWNVDAYSSDPVRKGASNIQEKYLKYLWDKEEMLTKRKRVAKIAQITGTGFYHPRWNPEGGEPMNPAEILKDVDPQTFISLFGNPKSARDFLLGDMIIPNGDIEIETLTPFEIAIDETATDVNDVQWVIISRIKNLEWIRNTYGVKVAAENIPMGVGPGLLYTLRGLVSPNIPNTSIPYATMIKESAVVHEYWSRPTKDYKKGRLIVVANNVVLMDEENPFHGIAPEIPLVKVPCIDVPGRFMGITWVDDAIPHQRAINKSLSDFIANLHDGCHSKWLVPRGAGLKAGALNRYSREVVEYNPVSGGSGASLKPERAEPAIVSQALIQNVTMGAEAINEQAGVNDVSKGLLPSGVTSGVQVQLLQEADETRLGGFLSGLKSADESLGTMCLQLCQRFMRDEERTFREIAGPNEEADIVSFKGEDLTFRKVKVVEGSLLNRSRASRKEGTLNALQYGGLNPAIPADKKAIISSLDLAEDYEDPSQLHCQLARHENKMMQRGEMPSVEEWHDDDAHLVEHEKELNQVSFLTADESYKVMLVQHRTGHKMNQQMKMMAMMPPEMPSGGSPKHSNNQAPQDELGAGLIGE